MTAHLLQSTAEELGLMAEVAAATPGDSRLQMCIQCGTCAGSCPPAKEMDHSPRHIFALLRADARREVLRSNTPWLCVSCYTCTVRCPQEIRITDVMYTLKRMSIETGQFKDSTAPDFSKSFVGMVENLGRSHEIGLATRHFIMHGPLGHIPGTAAIGFGMMTRKRLDIVPKRIRGMEQLKKILKRAKELEAAS